MRTHMPPMRASIAMRIFDPREHTHILRLRIIRMIMDPILRACMPVAEKPGRRQAGDRIVHGGDAVRAVRRLLAHKRGSMMVADARGTKSVQFGVLHQPVVLPPEIGGGEGGERAAEGVA